MSGAHFRVVPAQHGIVFDRAGDFAAIDDARAFLKAAGFSVGICQRGAPIAVMFGDYAISKWRNLNLDERARIHATLTGDNRNGPVVFRLLPAAPDGAIAALALATGEAA